MINNIKISICILVVLLGIYFFNLQSQNKYESNSSLIFTNEPDDIYKVLVQKGDEAIELIRIDTIWQISGNDTLVIKPHSIDNLFNQVLKSNRGTIISNNPNKYNDIILKNKSIHDNKNKDNKLKTKDKISEKIKDIIDKQVRPAVAQDGGDIIFENFENGIVYLTLRGACVGCPSSTATLKQGIENLLKHHFPQVKEVHAVN